MTVQPPNQTGRRPNLPPLRWKDDEDVAPPPSARPRTVELAVGLMLVGAFNWLVGLIAVLVTSHDDLRSTFAAQAKKTGTALTPKQLDNAVGFYIQVTVTITIVAILLYLLMARYVWKGRPWARLLSTMLAIIGVLIAFTLGLPAGLLPLRFIAAVLSVVTIAFLWYRPSNLWFNEMRAATRRYRPVAKRR